MAKKITKEEFQTRLDAEAPLKYLITDYTTAKGAGKVIHVDCGTEITQKSISNLLRIKSCPTCHPGFHKDSKESLQGKLDVYGIKVLSEYVNEKSKIDIQYPCGCIASKTVGPLKQSYGVRCLKCNPRITNHVISEGEANRRLKSATYGSFKICGTYSGLSVKTDIMCSDCSHTHYNVSPLQIMKRVAGCEVCGGSTKSVRERFLRQCLNDLNEPFESEKYIGTFKIDVYIPRLNLCIEYDGEFHDKEDAQKYDSDRDKYLINQGFNLLRIHHSDSVIQKLLPVLKI